MKIGILTAPFRQEPWETTARWAGENGFSALEIAVTPSGPHFSPDRALKDPNAVRQVLTEAGLEISALAYYANILALDAAERKSNIANLMASIDAAEALGVPVVCAGAGMPLPGKERIETIEQDLPQVYGPILEHAARKGVRIALENWFATNIRSLRDWDRLFEVLPNENFGLNYDPSHLYWQGIDYLYAVERFAGRIFHTHAKDVEIREDKLRYLGNQERGWWRYCIPGRGKIQWGEYLGVLRSVGYDGIVSIEHEDKHLGREDGFRKGQQHLAQFT